MRIVGVVAKAPTLKWKSASVSYSMLEIGKWQAMRSAVKDKSKARRGQARRAVWDAAGADAEAGAVTGTDWLEEGCKPTLAQSEAEDALKKACGSGERRVMHRQGEAN